MKKLAILAAATLAAFVSMIPLAFAGGMEKSSMEKSSAAAYERGEYIGAVVKNFQDERLGKVRDVVADSEGNISFAIVSHGGFLGFRAKETAIPFQALTYSAGLREFVIDLSKDRLDSAPRYARDLDLNDHGSAAAFYRFYGVTPPWGEMKEDHMMQEEKMDHEPMMEHEPMMKDAPMQEEPMG